MKKIFLLLCLSLALTTGASAQVSFNIKVGGSATNFINDDNAAVKSGFKVGIGSDILMNDFLYLQPSLMLGAKGAQYKAGIGSLSSTLAVNSLYLELPVLVGTKFWIGKTTRLNIGIGPYVAVGVGGKTTYKGSIAGYNFSSGGLSTFGDEVNMNRFDAGLALAVNFEFGNFILGLDTQMGLTNLAPNKALIFMDQNAKNMTASIYAGFYFNR